jgi:hypothetical protein
MVDNKMKILIKANQNTYSHLKNPDAIFSHVAGTWNFQLKKTFEELGHFVNFIGKEECQGVISNWNGYDLLFFHQLTSFRQDKAYSLFLLNQFKGIKILYMPCALDINDKEIIDCFDYIFVAGAYINYYDSKHRFPNKNIYMANWQAPRFDIIDKDKKSPYENKDSFKIIYTGIIIDKFLKIFKRLADMGEHMYIGGSFCHAGEQTVRPFTQSEIDNFPSNLHLISPNGIFDFGKQFPYLYHAQLGLVLQESRYVGAIRHKLVENLVCGLRSCVEESTSNASWVYKLDGGNVFAYDNFEDLYYLVQREKSTWKDKNKNKLKNMARSIFSQHKIYEDIFKKVTTC